MAESALLAILKNLGIDTDNMESSKGNDFILLLDKQTQNDGSKDEFDDGELEQVAKKRNLDGEYFDDEKKEEEAPQNNSSSEKDDSEVNINLKDKSESQGGGSSSRGSGGEGDDSEEPENGEGDGDDSEEPENGEDDGVKDVDDLDDPNKTIGDPIIPDDETKDPKKSKPESNEPIDGESEPLDDETSGNGDGEEDDSKDEGSGEGGAESEEGDNDSETGDDGSEAESNGNDSEDNGNSSNQGGENNDSEQSSEELEGEDNTGDSGSGEEGSQSSQSSSSGKGGAGSGGGEGKTLKDLFTDMVDSIEKSQGDSKKDMDACDQDKAEAKESPDNNVNPDISWEKDNSGKSKLRDLMNESMVEVNREREKLEQAKNEINNSKKDTYSSDTDDGDRQQQANTLLSGMGLSKITSLFNPMNTIKDWRKKLEKILDKALGIDITWDANAINKRIEDAPPGMEKEIEDIDNIVIMLDCSGSMGIDKFKNVIDHLSGLCAARKLNKTKFHILCWGTENISELMKNYTVIRGSKNLIATMLSMKAQSWGTAILQPFIVVKEKVPRADAIIILTDGEYNSTKGVYEKEVKEFIRRKCKQIIWVFTRNHEERQTLELDPTAKGSRGGLSRIVTFSK